MLSKSLIQFSVDGWGCVPFLLFDLRPNYGRVNGDLLQEGLYHPQVCCTQPYSSLQHPDCGFPLIGKDKRLMEASGMKKLNKGATGSCSDRWGYAQ